LAKAQGAIKNPQKNRKVTVTTKTGARYEFEYADLAQVIDAIKKPLADNSLCYIQPLVQDGNGKYQLHTKLMHSSGQWLESVTPLLVQEGGSQAFGGALTFMRRYSLTSLLGVAADSDDDANAAEGNAAEVRNRKPRSPEPSVIKPPVTSQVKDRIEPHELAAPKGNEWIPWGRQFLDTIKLGPEDDRIPWLSLNALRLKAMNDEAPKVFQRLATALATMGIDQDIIASLSKKNGD
jgi:hypothetical protein